MKNRGKKKKISAELYEMQQFGCSVNFKIFIYFTGTFNNIYNTNSLISKLKAWLCSEQFLIMIRPLYVTKWTQINTSSWPYILSFL